MQDDPKARASRDLIEFVSRYTALLEHQLVCIRETMQTTVETVMEGVTNISSTTESKKRTAEALLEKTYLNPDEETASAANDLQDMVDAVFDAAARGEDLGQQSEPEELLQTRMTRINERFSTHLNHLDELDQGMKGLLLGMMGALSADDVIAQRMEHVVQALHGLKISLSYVLLDFESRSGPEELAKWKNELKSYTFKNYTMEDEKEKYFEAFGEQKKAS